MQEAAATRHNLEDGLILQSDRIRTLAPVVYFNE